MQVLPVCPEFHPLALALAPPVAPVSGELIRSVCARSPVEVHRACLGGRWVSCSRRPRRLSSQASRSQPQACHSSFTPRDGGTKENPPRRRFQGGFKGWFRGPATPEDDPRGKVEWLIEAQASRTANAGVSGTTEGGDHPRAPPDRENPLKSVLGPPEDYRHGRVSGVRPGVP